MRILQWLLQTDSGVLGLILRLTLAVVVFPHGAQKVLGPIKFAAGFSE
jgi:putative oxidoreductase